MKSRSEGINPPARLYAERDIEEQGEHYVRHVNAMTAEGLHSKSDIAAELAHRDIEIERLTKALRVAELKASGSLANNLCPDHRDKQVGKPCLACEIELLVNSSERSFQMLEACGVPRERARSIANGIDVLATRYSKEAQAFDVIRKDADRWRALRNCARITAMGSAGLGDDKAADDYGHVTLNFWTGVDDVDRGPEYARDWLDRFVEKALRAKVSRPAAAGLATGSTDQPAPETIVSPQTAREPPLEQRCRRGHVWHVTFTEWRDYKGDLPMPCPVCIREGLRP